MLTWDKIVALLQAIYFNRKGNESFGRVIKARFAC